MQAKEPAYMARLQELADALFPASECVLCHHPWKEHWQIREVIDIEIHCDRFGCPCLAVATRG